MFDDHVVARHSQRALRQRHGADHREKLGREADAQRDGEEQRFEGVVFERQTRQEDEQDEHEGRAEDQQTEPPQSVFELRFRRAAPQPRRDVAEHRLRPRRDCDRRADAAHDRRAEEDEMWSVWAGRLVAVGGRSLGGGQRLARQHRLLNREVPRVEQTSVGRHHVAGRQAKHVVRHYLSHRYLGPGPITEHGRCRDHRRSEPVRSLARIDTTARS